MIEGNQELIDSSQAQIMGEEENEDSWEMEFTAWIDAGLESSNKKVGQLIQQMCLSAEKANPELRPLIDDVLSRVGGISPEIRIWRDFERKN